MPRRKKTDKTDKTDKIDKTIAEQLLEYGRAIRDHRLSRRQPIFQMADELGIPSSILIDIENGQPVDANHDDLSTWLERIKSKVKVEERLATFVPLYLRG